MSSRDKFRVFWRVLFAIAILTTGFFQYRFLFGQIRDFEILGFVDHDIIYQVERFLLNLHQPGIDLMNSGSSDYGSEFFLLIPFFRAYSALISDPSSIQAYYFLTTVHLLCGLCAFLIMRRIVIRLGMTEFENLLLALLVFSSPLFVQYLGFLKPDPNIILLCILSALLFLDKFHESGKIGWIIGAFLLAGLATAIKWWGFFLLFPLCFALFHARNIKLILGLLGLGTVLFIYAGQRVFRKNHDFYLSLALFLKTNATFFLRNHTVLVSLVVALSVILLISMIVLRARGHILGHESIGWISAASVTSILLIGTYMVFNLPFLLSQLATESVDFYARYVIVSAQNSQGSGYEPGGPLINFWKWIQDSYVSGLFSPIMGLFAIAALLALYKKKTKMPFLMKAICLFIIPIVLFLFFIVTKKGWAQEAMILPFIWLVLFFCANELRTYYGSSTLSVWIFAIGIGLQILWQNSIVRFGSDYYSTYSTVSLYKSRDTFDQMVSDYNRDLGQSVKNTVQPVMFCNRNFPLRDSEFKAQRLAICDDADKTVNSMVRGQALILLDNQDVIFSNLAKHPSLRKAANIPGKRVHRDGEIVTSYATVLMRE